MGAESLAGAAGSATPWGAIIQGGLGLGQMIGGAIGAAKGRKELKSLLANAPKYTPDKGLMSYYNQAQQLAGVSPTQSAAYKRQMQNINRITAGGLQSAQDRRGGLAAAPSLARSASDAALNAEIAGEQQQAQRRGQLFSAAQAAAGENKTAFDINVMRPWETKAQMAGQRAAGGAQAFNIGASNIFGAGSSLAQSDLYKQIYGGGRRASTTGDMDFGLSSLNTGNSNQATINRLLAARPTRY